MCDSYVGGVGCGVWGGGGGGARLDICLLLISSTHKPWVQNVCRGTLSTYWFVIAYCATYLALETYTGAHKGGVNQQDATQQGTLRSNRCHHFPLKNVVSLSPSLSRSHTKSLTHSLTHTLSLSTSFHPPDTPPDRALQRKVFHRDCC